MVGTAFGLDVESEIPLSLLAGASASPTGRALGLSAAAPAETGNSDWPESAELVCDEREADGGVNFQIEAHAELGYLISGPRYGAHRLSVDGRWLRCAPGGVPEHAWQRLLIAQVLPFAALLHGLEVFHASAIVWRSQAVALLGRSGAGKTSLALELCRREAGFLADDVLALERRGDGLLAHPGTPVAGVTRARGDEAHDADQTHPAQEEVVAVNARERLVRVSGAREPAPLGALFFLDRRADGPERPRFESAADAPMLLSATFNFVLATPARLRGLLEVCALAARLPVERVVCGPATGVSELADAIELRLEALS
jgi:hypothetical protein